MLKRVIQLFFVLIGGTLGFIFIPELAHLDNASQLPSWMLSQYAGALVGAILLFVATFWLAGYIVRLIKLLEEAILKAPIIDVTFGTFGMIIGLIVAYLIPLNAFEIPVVSTVLPIFLTVLLGYLGFQIGFKKTG